MADRALGQDATILIDLPGTGLDDATISVWGPLGETVVDEAEATALGSGRYRYVVDADLVTNSGIWSARATSGSISREVEFTVGPNTRSALEMFDLRLSVAARVDDAIDSTVTHGQVDRITDDTLIGGAKNYVGWWVVLGDGQEIGKFRRVIGFNGTALELSAPFHDAIPDGTRYALMRLAPREIDRAIRSAINELSDIARVPVTISGNVVADAEVPVPDGMVVVSEVWHDGTQLRSTDWNTAPGRRIVITTDTIDDDDEVTLVGVREARMPLWEDSQIDIIPQALVARAAVDLHAMRARGQGRDTDEHLRRQLASLDEFERSLRRAAGRVSRGNRLVIP